jgi:hypothetical protein
MGLQLALPPQQEAMGLPQQPMQERLEEQALLPAALAPPMVALLALRLQ